MQRCQPEGEPIIHLCDCAASDCRGNRMEGREVVHVDTLRLWGERPTLVWTKPMPIPAPGTGRAGPKDLADKLNELKDRWANRQRGGQPEAAGSGSQERRPSGQHGRATPPAVAARTGPQSPDRPAGPQPEGRRDADRGRLRREDHPPHQARQRDRGARAPPRGSVADRLMAHAVRHRDEAVDRQERRRDRGRNRRDSRSRSRGERGRRRRASSESSSGADQGFRAARGTHGNQAHSVALRAPGRLLESCLTRMGEYLGKRQGTSELGEVAAAFTPYLSSVLLPTFGPDANLRNTNELQNLARALDYLMVGDVPRACDVLAQRFKAAELATQDGNWSVARHLQLGGDSRVSTITQQEREAATQQERGEARFRTTMNNR